MEGVEYIKYSASPKLWVEERWKGKAICGGGLLVVLNSHFLPPI
jgi:hypothetical protein